MVTFRNPLRRKIEVVPITQHVGQLTRQVFYGEDVGVYVIKGKESLFMIEGPTHLDNSFIEWLESHKKPISIIFSHGPTTGEALKLKKELGATLYLHAEDRNNRWLTLPAKECTLWEGKDLNLYNELFVYHSGGHSPGHILGYFPKDDGILFCGDEFYQNKQGELRYEDELSTSERLKKYADDVDLIIRNMRFERILPFHYAGIDVDGKKRLMDLLRSTKMGR